MRWELDWIESRARISTERVAVVEGESGSRLTFGELNVRATNLAIHLASIGVEKGDRIALLSPNHICYFDLLFACGKIGAIFVPLNWRLSQSEIAYIIKDCSPKVVAVNSSLQNLLPTESTLTMLFVDSEEYVEALQPSWNTLDTQTDFSFDDPLAIIYTGGTTGKPKGVVLSHESITWNAINTILSWNLTADDVTLTYLPMFHTGGLNALSLPILMMGGKVVIANDFDPIDAMKLINDEGCTVVLMVPTMYHMITNCEAFETTKFPSMHTFLSGGAPCPLEIYEAFEKKGLSFKEGYGLTEAGPNNFFIDPKVAKYKRGSVGKPMILNDTKVLMDDGKEAGPGEVGELLLRGKHVFKYYWNNPTATKESLRNGWLHTGDLARKDNEGYYYIVGRKKEMIITGGENVYPLEVEHCISQHPSVNEVAVIGVPHPKWGEIVVAVVSIKSGKAVTDKILKVFCQYELGKYKIPKHFVFVDEVPKTHVGKIDKNYLKKMYENIGVEQGL